MYKVVKRNGKEVQFDKEKVIKAILKAAVATGEYDFQETANLIADDVIQTYSEIGTDTMSVEDIQDLIEIDLYEIASAPNISKEYIRYRYKREMARDYDTSLFKELNEKYRASNVQNQNANMDENSFGGRKGEAESAVARKMALEYMMSSKTRDNHLNNIVYQHDLDWWIVGGHNCLSVPIDNLLANGFDTRQTDVRPAGSINTALQLVAVLFQLQSLQQFGGVSATHLDWSMVPYIRMSFYKHFKDGLKWIENSNKNKSTEFNKQLSIDSEIYKNHPDVYNYAWAMTKKEVHQGVEGLFHNLNTLQSRSGNQLPFSSINFGTCTLPEGRMIIKALLSVSIEGMGKLHKTSIFPCSIFLLKRGVNRHPGDPNYDLFQLALKSTAQRLYPNYGNCDWTNQKEWVKYDRNLKQTIIDELSESEKNKLKEQLGAHPEIAQQISINPDLSINWEENPSEMFSTMGCRTINGANINAKNYIKENIDSMIKNGCLANDVLSAIQKDGRGNIAPATIILPELAYQAVHYYDDRPCGDWEEDTFEFFMQLLEEKIEEAKDSLIERYKWICSQPWKAAKFMYGNHTMCGYKPEEGIKSALQSGTLVIGQVGLAEALQLLAECDHTTEKGMMRAKQIEQLFSDKCNEFKKRYSLNFGVYFTPAQNLAYTAMTRFKKAHGEIPNVSDREYFTNSMHVPVWKKISPFEKIDIESQLVKYNTAGSITYIELDSGVKNNLEALETVVNYAMDKDISYFAINVPNDTCLECGYCDEFNDKCPMCGSEDIQQLRRVTGYLTGSYTTAFNKGKIAEVQDRVKHAKFNYDC